MSFGVKPPWSQGLRALAAIVAMALPAARGAESAVAGTMPEDFLPGLRPLLETALKQSPRMIANEMMIAVADAQRLYSGVSPLLPSLGGSLAYGTTKNRVTNNGSASSAYSGFNYNFGLNQNLFQWGALRNQLEVQKVAETIAEKNYAEGYRIYVGNLRRQYLALIVNKLSLRNARLTLKLSQNALAVASDRLKSGAIAASEVITPQLDVDDKQLWTDRTEQTYEYARRAFAHEVGLTELADSAVPEEMPAPKYSTGVASELLADLLRGGGRDTFAAQIDELNVRQWQLQYNIAKVRLLPKFFASATLSQNNQTTSATANSVQQTALTSENYYLNAQWTLFDGLATRGQKLQALYYRRYYERQLEAVTSEAMDQAQNARRNLDFSARAMALAERRRDLAKSGLAVVQSEFQRGNLSQDTLNGSLDALRQNEAATASARADFLSAWSDFVSLVGVDPAMNNLPARYVRSH